MNLFDNASRIFFTCVIICTLAVSIGSLLPVGNLFHVAPYTVNILGKYLCLAVLAVSIDLVWGYLGILSLGHGAFFALGGYAFGMYLMRQIGAQGVYATANLPDFMVFLNWTELPWYWYGTGHFLFACFLVMFIPGALAFLFGWTAFRSRVYGVYFSVISQAMTLALMLAFYRNELGFGGNNGLTDFKSILGFELASPGMGTLLFVLSAIALLLTYTICRVVACSRLGLVCIAVRDNENRIRFTGYRVEHVKLAMFTLSAILAGIAGALYVPQVGIINPNLFSPLFSVEMVVCVGLGGRGKLYGAVIGAFVVNWLKSWLTTDMPEAWLFVLGAIFVLVTIFLPDGIIAIFMRVRPLLQSSWKRIIHGNNNA